MDPVQQGPVFAGIDWGGGEHQLCVVDRDGRMQLEKRVSHDVAGLNELVHQLAKHGDGVPVAIERAEGLLVEQLQAHGHPVFPVSPRIAARARERYGSRRSRTIGSMRSCSPTLFATSTGTGGHWRFPRRCWPSSRR
jgi:predicted oxidoreductase